MYYIRVVRGKKLATRFFDEVIGNYKDEHTIFICQNTYQIEQFCNLIAIAKNYSYFDKVTRTSFKYLE